MFNYVCSNFSLFKFLSGHAVSLTRAICFNQKEYPYVNDTFLDIFCLERNTNEIRKFFTERTCLKFKKF